MVSTLSFPLQVQFEMKELFYPSAIPMINSKCYYDKCKLALKERGRGMEETARLHAADICTMLMFSLLAAITNC
jgi:hypothetical protein